MDVVVRLFKILQQKIIISKIYDNSKYSFNYIFDLLEMNSDDFGVPRKGGHYLRKP